MKPRPRHSKCGRRSKISASITASARPVAFVRDDAVVVVLDLRVPSVSCLADHVDRPAAKSSGSKPETTIGFCSPAGRTELRRFADHRRDVARPDEAVQAQVGRVENRRGWRRHDRHVVAEHREVRDALVLGALEQVSAVDGVVVSKPIAMNTTCGRGWFAGEVLRVHRRVDHADVGTGGVGVEERPGRRRARA